VTFTPTKLRRIIKDYQKARAIPTWTKAVKAFAAELPATHGTVWRYLSGARKIQPMVAERIGFVASRAEANTE
jgi:hypothetical protein